VRTSVNCIGFKPHPDGMAVDVDCTSGEPVVVGSHVLLAVGRQPNTDDLGLDKAGVAADARGYIVVDDGLTTTVPGIWALGDCNGRAPSPTRPTTDYEIVRRQSSRWRQPPGERPDLRLRALWSIRRSGASACRRLRRTRHRS